MTQNPFKPIKESETPKPRPAAKTEVKVTPYRWPGEAPKGRGDFNRVSEGEMAGERRVSNWMR